MSSTLPQEINLVWFRSSTKAAQNEECVRLSIIPTLENHWRKVKSFVAVKHLADCSTDQHQAVGFLIVPS